MPSPAHAVQFYEQTDFLVERIVEFMEPALRRGAAGVAIVTPEVHKALAARLPPGVDYLDAHETLAAFMQGGWPDRALFESVVGRVLGEAARRGNGQVVAFGEMVSVLVGRDQGEAAIRLEELWNEIAATHTFSLLCGYSIDTVARGGGPERFLRICRTHSHVSPAESLPEGLDPDGHDGVLPTTMAVLQQQALALRNEVALRLHAEEALASRERDFRDFVENAVMPMHMVDGQGIVRWANRAELELLGRTAAETIGRHIAEFHADRAAIDRILAKLAAGEQLRNEPAVLRRQDGTTRHVRIDSNARIENGRLVHTRCITRDVTAEVRLAEERQRRIDELDAEGRRKDEFIALLGHELRNPMAAVRMAVDVIRLRGEVPDGTGRPLDVIDRQLTHLTRLVDDLLDVARVTRGLLVLQRDEVDPAVAVHHAVDMARPLFVQRGHTLETRIGQGLPVLHADAVRLTQAVSNLLLNAAKYTPPGGKVEVEATRDGDDVVVRVRDNGAGMPPELVASAFQPFVRGKDAAARAAGGLGIGLTLVKSIVQMHGGRVEASSPGPGKGSAFTIRLPVAQPAVAVAKAPAPSAL
jgi:PAS domain S-box-containing protein